MPQPKPHALARWIDTEHHGSELVLAGSLGPGLTLNELINLSTDPETTAQHLNFHDMTLAGATGPIGGQKLREQIANLYDQDKANITADDVITANATTGANLLVLQAFLSPGDHVVTMYPTYGALLEIPRHLGAEMSYWRLDSNKNWTGNLSELETLLKPTTKLLILNNPHNPTGSTLSTAEQKDILTLAARHHIIVHCDEIFRPLFHTSTSGEKPPTSIAEHAFYDRTVVTGSLSKSWCFSGVRLGWCVTRNPELKASIRGLRGWILEATSMIDEAIATEVLSPRCRDKIFARISNIARENRAALSSFIANHGDSVQCDLPPGGATAFVKFSDPRTGKPVDDLEFCRALKSEKGVLLSPGSLCFGQLRDGDFRGYVRMHLTCLPDVFAKGLERIGEFILTEQFGRLAVEDRGGVNGEKVNGTK